MIITETQIAPYQPGQQRQVLDFLEQQTRVHLHLDWRPIHEWLRDEVQLAYVAVHRDQIQGIIAFSQPYTGFSWLRLLALRNGVPKTLLYQLLDHVLPILRANGADTVYLLQLDGWIEGPLQASSFEEVNHLIHLERPPGPAEKPEYAPIIHTVRRRDLEIVCQLDHAAFAPLWQMHTADLEAAYFYATHFTLAIQEDHTVGYQLTTSYPDGLHLARLAVHPQYQGMGIGRQLILDLIANFGKKRITVNTQADNMPSRRLYKTLGFVERSLITPVWAWHLEAGVGEFIDDQAHANNSH